MAVYQARPKRPVKDIEVIDEGDDPATWWNDAGEYVPAVPFKEQNRRGGETNAKDTKTRSGKE